jgi:hypothetical protein
MTSFPGAIDTAHTAIESILKGTVLPDKIVLYLAETEFADKKIPKTIEVLTRNPMFEIRWTERNIRSYKKLVPALKDFPEDIVITTDDDIVYPDYLVARLLCIHKLFPKAVVGHRCRRIRFDGKGNLLPYLKWTLFRPKRYFKFPMWPSYRTLTTGGSGALYPPHSLDMAMLVPELFETIAPTVDDIWFWASAVSAGTKTVVVPFGHWRIKGTGKPEDLTLFKINANSGKDVNLNVMNAIFEKYPNIKQRLA